MCRRAGCVRSPLPPKRLKTWAWHSALESMLTFLRRAGIMSAAAASGGIWRRELRRLFHFHKVRY
jgi:hypothetical protein